MPIWSKVRDQRGARRQLSPGPRGRAYGSRIDGTLEGRDDWGAYTVNEAALLRHGAGVEEETNDTDVTYARFPGSVPTRYRDGLLPDSTRRTR